LTISRDDIERKAMELVDAVDETAESVKNKAMIGALIVAGVVVAAFLIGRRRGSRNKTLVEVYKV
jgi:hypothetical protein